MTQKMNDEPSSDATDAEDQSETPFDSEEEVDFESLSRDERRLILTLIQLREFLTMVVVGAVSTLAIFVAAALGVGLPTEPGSAFWVSLGAALAVYIFNWVARFLWKLDVVSTAVYHLGKPIVRVAAKATGILMYRNELLDVLRDHDETESKLIARFI